MKIASQICCVLLILSCVQLHAQVLNLDSCYSKAMRNYPLIKQYQLIEKSTEYNLSNAGKAYLPQFSFTGIAGYLIKGLPAMSPSAEESEDKFQFIGIAQINQTIYDGGATHSNKEIIKSTTSVQKAELDVAMYDIRQRVNQLYFGILLLDEQLNLLEILNENLGRNLQSVKLSNENGLAYSSDVDEVKVEILKAEQRIEEINYMREGYVMMLGMMMGEELANSVQLTKPGVADVLPAEDIRRPELTVYEYQRNLANAQFAATKVGYIPKVGLLGAGIMVQPGFPFGTAKLNSLAIAGLSVSWNTNSLYQSGNEKALVKLNLSRIDVQEETFKFNTKLQLTQKRSDLQKQKRIVDKDAEIVSLKSNIKKAYELKYKNGMCTMNDLILATNAENESRSNQALHEAQLLMTQYDYKTTLGY